MLKMIMFFFFIFSFVNAQNLINGKDNYFNPAAYYLKGGDSQKYGKKNHYIQQKNKMFIPKNLVISLNSKVYFPNLDSFGHNVYSLDGPMGVFDLGIVKKIDLNSDKKNIQTIVIDKPGVTKVKCSIHPKMINHIFSVDSKYIAYSQNGTYKFNVKPGSYQLYRMDLSGKEIKIKDVKVN